MHLRLRNAAPCGIKFMRKRPGCFPSGTLFISGSDEEGFEATFGDLTVPIESTMRMIALILLAGGDIVAENFIETEHLRFNF